MSETKQSLLDDEQVVRLVIAGSGKDNKLEGRHLKVLLENLIELLENINTAEECRLRFLVAGMTYSSPYAITLSVEGAESERFMLTMKHYGNWLDSCADVADIRGDRIPLPKAQVTRKILKNLHNLTKQLDKKNVGIAKLEYGSRHKTLGESLFTPKHHDIITRVMHEMTILDNAESQMSGTFFGILEQINIHETHKFNIYDRLGNKTECTFPKDKLNKVKQLIGEYVDVSGIATFKGEGVAPASIRVEKIAKYQEPAADIKASDVYGSHPNFGKGKTASEIIREIRSQ